MAVLGFHVAFIGADEVSGRVGPEWLGQLRYGLILFFALSGFLLYRPFVKAVLDSRPQPDLRAYARNRALRILPAYWVILLLASFVLGTTVAQWPNEIGALTQPDVLVANLLLVQNYDLVTVYSGITPAWTLGIEVIFYMLLPLLGLVAARIAERKAGSLRWRLAALLAPAVALVTLGLATRLFLRFGTDPGSDAALLLPVLFPCQADLFGLGMIIAVISTADFSSLRSLSALWQGVALALPAVILAGLALAYPAGAHAGAPADFLVGVASAMMIFAVVNSDGPVTRCLELRPVVWLGLCSYSLYLWQLPAILWLDDQGLDADGTGQLLMAGALAAVLVTTLAAITYRLVERPALVRKKRMQSTP